MAAYTMFRVGVPAAALTAATARARSEGRDVAAVVVELLAAYAAGPDTAAARPKGRAKPASKAASKAATPDGDKAAAAADEDPHDGEV
ncbi:hypothetical protein ACU61A_42575 [Pseudonocardia sichuanensis]